MDRDPTIDPVLEVFCDLAPRRTFSPRREAAATPSPRELRWAALLGLDEDEAPQALTDDAAFAVLERIKERRARAALRASLTAR